MDALSKREEAKQHFENMIACVRDSLNHFHKSLLGKPPLFYYCAIATLPRSLFRSTQLVWHTLAHCVLRSICASLNALRASHFAPRFELLRFCPFDSLGGYIEPALIDENL